MAHTAVCEHLRVLGDLLPASGFSLERQASELTL